MQLFRWFWSWNLSKSFLQNVSLHYILKHYSNFSVHSTVVYPWVKIATKINHLTNIFWSTIQAYWIGFENNFLHCKFFKVCGSKTHTNQIWLIFRWHRPNNWKTFSITKVSPDRHHKTTIRLFATCMFCTLCKEFNKVFTCDLYPHVYGWVQRQDEIKPFQGCTKSCKLN